MKRINKNQIESWLNDTATELVNQLLESIHGLEVPESHEDLRHTLNLYLVQHMVERLVLGALNKHVGKGLPGLEEYNLTALEFSQIKTDVQHAVCTAFESSFQIYAGVQSDYYCLIAPFPEPINKASC